MELLQVAETAVAHETAIGELLTRGIETNRLGEIVAEGESVGQMIQSSRDFSLAGGVGPSLSTKGSKGL